MEDLNKYFDEMFKDIDENIVLDEQQRNAILSEDDKVLIIAGAGTGKTTTMAAKVKYLVDIKKVDPQKILVMSYTKKATKELESIIVDQFGIDANVTTFHSLGYNYLRKIFNNRVCYVLEYNEKEAIFYEYFKELFKDKKKIERIYDSFSRYFTKAQLFSSYFLNNYKNYDDYDKFFNDYKKYKILEAQKEGIETKINNYILKNLNSSYIRTIRGEFVKSPGECIIANYLYKNGIEYSYEEVYSEIMEDRKSYRPDFTLDLGGERVYLEYFGLDNVNYNRIKDKKIKYHEEHNKDKFIYIEKTKLENLEAVLALKLNSMGFIYHKKTNEELYDKILDRNKLVNITWFKYFMFDMVDTIKEYNERENVSKIINDAMKRMRPIERNDATFQATIVVDFYNYYIKKSYTPEKYGFDYADLIYYANKYIDKLSDESNDLYEYIIIDEYQDISESKYLLAKNTMNRNNSKLFAVGDDWQSIYAFSGSKIDYIYEIEKYFPDIKTFTITNTYRNAQELIDSAGTFIMRNPSQIKKELHSDKNIQNPIVIEEYSKFDKNGEYIFRNEYLCLKNTIRKIHLENPEHNIMILARKNKFIKAIFDDEDFIESLDNRIIFKEFRDLEIEAMSIHKSKGLTCDEAIIIGLNRYFPSDRFQEFWIKELLKPKIQNEGIPYPEERRLFYVALTRTKNKVHLLSCIENKYRSPFINEIERIIKENEANNA